MDPRTSANVPGMAEAVQQVVLPRAPMLTRCVRTSHRSPKSTTLRLLPT